MPNFVLKYFIDGKYLTLDLFCSHLCLEIFWIHSIKLKLRSNKTLFADFSQKCLEYNLEFEILLLLDRFINLETTKVHIEMNENYLFVACLLLSSFGLVKMITV